MTRIILIRHATVQINKDEIASNWELATDSQKACVRLAEQIREYQPIHVFTSLEQKAIQTGRFIANTLDIETSTCDNLHETERDTVQFYENKDEFLAKITEAMSNPGEVIFGDESFGAAKDRLKQQLTILAESNKSKTFGVVSHGRILAMLLGELMGESPITVWKDLKMPAYAVLSWSEMKIIRAVNSV